MYRLDFVFDWLMDGIRCDDWQDGVIGFMMGWVDNLRDYWLDKKRMRPFLCGYLECCSKCIFYEWVGHCPPMNLPYWLSTDSRSFFVFSLNLTYYPTNYLHQRSFRFPDDAVILFLRLLFFLDQSFKVLLFPFHLQELSLHEFDFFPFADQIVHHGIALLFQSVDTVLQLL